MSSLNKVLLIGYLGKDPEVRYTQDGTPVAAFGLASGEQWTNKSGQRQQHMKWHTIVAWDKLAEIVQRYTNRGKQVHVEGRLKTRQRNDREGNKRRTTEVIANQIVFWAEADKRQGSQADIRIRRPRPIQKGRARASPMMTFHSKFSQSRRSFQQTFIALGTAQAE